jgi:hypothetical protein
MKEGNDRLRIRENYRLHFQTRDINIRQFTPIGRDLRLVEENNPKILGIETAKQGSQ